MKKIVAFGLSLVVAFSGICYSGATSTEVKAATEWSILWSDEFDGTSLNMDNWSYEIGNGDWGWGNGEKEYYTNRTENVEVSNGTLKIKALKENYGGQKYTSGRIITRDKQDFKYGKIEARIKLPSFSGAWPAFWTLGANQKTVGWPRCGEIDIMEAINTENNTHGAVHWNVESANYNGQGDNSTSNAKRLPVGYQRTEWHTYGIIWNEKSIQWYVDDQIFMSQGISAEHMSEFRNNHYIILNLAIGGQWPGYNIDDSAFPDRSTMEVDYVRVYEEVEVPETTTIDDATEEVTKVKIGNTKVKVATKKKGAKAVKISLKNIKGAKGYQVAIYKTKNNAKNNKKALVKKLVKKVNITIKTKKIKSKKKLYVRARAYKKVDGKKLYGAWSKIKKVKIKK